MFGPKIFFMSNNNSHDVGLLYTSRVYNNKMMRGRMAAATCSLLDN